MMGLNPTTIEWVRNPNGSLGFTSNPFTGCLNGCPYCYARLEAHGRCKEKDMAGMPMAHSDSEEAMDPFAPRYHPARLTDIEKRKKPAGIFLCNRSDFFADYWPDIWQQTVWDTVKACPQHIIYLLTKQSAQLRKFSPFPDHCRVGVTATDYWKYVDACNYLSRIEAKVKYLSLEPLLSWDKKASYFFESGGVNQVIIGAQTKPYAPPKIEWLEEIVKAADAASVPVFLKNNLQPLLQPVYEQAGCIDNYFTGVVGANDVPELRQEMPA